MNYVYFIQHGFGSIKIAVSNDPEERCKNLQTGNQKKLRVVAQFPFKSRKEALQVEKDLHKVFEFARLEGEWFHKKILSKFKSRAKLFPNKFNGGPINKYDKLH